MADKSIAALVFRQLFSRCRCPCRQDVGRQPSQTRRDYHISSKKLHSASNPRSAHGRGPISRLETATSLAPRQWRRHEETYARNRGLRNRDDKQELAWKTRKDVIPADRAAEFKEYDTTTSVELATKTRRPRRTKMLMRDFIEDSLYNPHYGYFSSQAVIFNPGSDPFDFSSMKNEADFYDQLGKRYTSFEDGLDFKEHNDSRQLWHTPTELFRPHYAEAIARYMVINYKLTSYPYHDLIIYELGAGNGTFMLNVLDYIRRTDEDVYARTQYKIIEISTSLAKLQASALSRSPYGADHIHKVEIINKSIFAWDAYIPSPCFVLALEVVDNFAHDIIRWDPRTETPLQGNVLIDEAGEMYNYYAPCDPLTARFLRVRDAACGGENGEGLPLTHPLRWSRWKRNLRGYLPFAPNLSDPEWVPTRTMQFFDILQRYFPAHRLVLADFDTLPGAVDQGHNSPVVQTRFKRRTVPVGTALVSCLFFVKLRTKKVDMLIRVRIGPTRLLRHPLPHRLQQHRAHLPSPYRPLYPLLLACGFHGYLGSH